MRHANSGYHAAAHGAVRGSEAATHAIEAATHANPAPSRLSRGFLGLAQLAELRLTARGLGGLGGGSLALGLVLPMQVQLHVAQPDVSASIASAVKVRSAPVEGDVDAELEQRRAPRCDQPLR